MRLRLVNGWRVDWAAWVRALFPPPRCRVALAWSPGGGGAASVPFVLMARSSEAPPRPASAPLGPPSGAGSEPRRAPQGDGRSAAEAILGVLPLLSLIIGDDGRVRYLSPALQGLLPGRLDEHLGRAASAVLFDLGGRDLVRCVSTGLPSVAYGTSALLSAPSRLTGDRRDLGVTVIGIPLDGSGTGLRGTLVAIQSQTEAILRLEDQPDTSLLLSHELRSPLAYITASAELLCEGGLSAEEHQTLLAGIRAESGRLTTLLETVLDMERVRSGASVVSLEPLSLGSLAAQVCSEMGSSHARRTFLLHESPGLPLVHADRARTMIVLRNLLENAIKHSRSDTPIVTTVSHRDADEVAVSVDDEGDGIAPENLGRLFQRFQQVGNVATGSAGTHGLGLYICRVLVAAQGGRIGVQTAPGRGARFWFTLRTVPKEAADGQAGVDR